MSLARCSLFVLLIAGGSIANAGSKEFIRLDADGEIKIDPTGHVSDYHLESKLSPQIATLVDRQVHGWAFEPVLVGGKPVFAKTALHLQLTAEPTQGDNFALRISSVRFGDIERMGGQLPTYPPAAARAGLSALVMLRVRLDEHGKVVEVAPYQTSLSRPAASERIADEWRRMFEKASVEAARTWHYRLAEIVDGKPASVDAILPIAFHMGTSAPDEWRAYVRGPVREISWHKDSAGLERDQLAATDGSTAVAESRFHLKSDVIGRVL